MSTSISPDRVRESVDYDHENGRISWRTRPITEFASRRDQNAWNTRYAGTAIGWQDVHGYLRVRLGRHRLLAHRIAWAIFYDRWPDGLLDHINGDPSDNRISNLREVSPSGNARNQKRRSDNTSGVSGVNWSTRDRRWQARIGKNGRECGLGSYKDKADAIAARKAALVENDYSERHGL